MPEGPEVKHIATKLSDYLEDKSLIGITILGGRYEKHGNPPGFGDFMCEIPLTIAGVKTKGKYMWWEFAGSDWVMTCHLAMSGAWTKKEEKHNRIEFMLEDSDSVYFNDMRNFGRIEFMTKDQLKKKLDDIAPSMLDGNVTLDQFRKRLKAYPGKNLYGLFMDGSGQKRVVSGVGNYIINDSLYIAKLLPQRLVKSLSNQDISNLFDAINLVMQESYKAGGASREENGTYRNFDGVRGAYKFRIYGKNKDPDGNPVTKENIVTRTAHFVPAVQI
jgi:formamidopyrimidine-DNA glycosylase